MERKYKHNKKQMETAEQLLQEHEYLAALELYEEKLSVYEQAADWQDYVQCRVDIGKVYMVLAKYKPVDLPQNAASFLETTIQLTEEKLGKQDLLYLEAQKHKGIYLSCQMTQVGKGITFLENLYEQHVELLGEDHEWIVSIMYELSDRYIMKSYPDKENALKGLQKVLTFFEAKAASFPEELATIHLNLVIFLFLIKKIDKGNYHFQKAHEIIEKYGVKSSKVDYKLNKIYHFKTFRSLLIEEAIFYGMRRVNICLNVKKADQHYAFCRYHLPISYLTLGVNYQKLEKNDKALYYLKEGETIINCYIDENHKLNADLKTYFSLIENDLGNYSKAISLLNEAVVILERLPASNIGTSYFNLGVYYHKTKKLDQAQIYFDKVIAHSKQSKNPFFLFRAYYMKGRIYLEQSLYKESFQSIKQAFQCLDDNYQPINKYENPRIKDKVEIKSYINTFNAKGGIVFNYFWKESRQLIDMQLGLFTFQIELQLIEQLKKEVYHEDEKQFWAVEGSIGTIYHHAINSIALLNPSQEADWQAASQKLIQYNQKHYPESSFPYLKSIEDCQKYALQCCQKAKGSLLLESVYKNENLINAAIPKELQVQKQALGEVEMQLRKQERLLELDLLKTTDKQTKRDLEDKINQVKQDYYDNKQKLDSLQQKIKENDPDLLGKSLEEQLPSLEEIQRSLKKGQCILSYFLGDDHSIVVFVISQNTFQIISLSELEKGFQLDKYIQKFIKAINQLRYKKYVELGFQLYQVLLEPLETHLKEIGTEHLIIIPHQSLNQLPFECLISSKPSEMVNNGAALYSELSYLIKTYTISYHYSTALWHQAQNTTVRPTKNALESFVGFAPVYGASPKPMQAPSFLEKDKEGKIPPPVIPVHAIKGGVGTARSMRIGENDYEALLHSEEEVKNVQQLFEEKEALSFAYVHEAATVSQFQEAVKGKKYIHIAAHGYEEKFLEDMPGIIFSPEVSNKSHEDAIFYLLDAYRLRLDADLVVLSSCKSGIGKYVVGEGMMAINRGFLYAGAKNIVYTLFKIYDEASSIFIQHFFYQIVQHQKSYSQALRLAKLHLIKQVDYMPKHWAGFVLIGQ